MHPFVKSDGKVKIMGWEMAASGYAAVWATENTRAAIFDALMRKEVYATTGPRMIVRFFGGWDFQPADAQVAHAAMRLCQGRADGWRLGAAPHGKAPSFLVAALKDPIGANLDRIQIVKGWLDAKGDVQEKVYDVVWSRRPQARRRRQAAAGRQHGRCGQRHLDQHDRRSELITVWTDPDFDPAAARLLLRSRDRNPDAALDRLRRQALRHQDAEGGADDDAGARLHLAHLVHALGGGRP